MFKGRDFFPFFLFFLDFNVLELKLRPEVRSESFVDNRVEIPTCMCVLCNVARDSDLLENIWNEFSDSNLKYNDMSYLWMFIALMAARKYEYANAVVQRIRGLDKHTMLLLFTILNANLEDQYPQIHQKLVEPEERYFLNTFSICNLNLG